MYIMKPIIWLLMMKAVVSIVQECNLQQGNAECPLHSSYGSRAIVYVIMGES